MKIVKQISTGKIAYMQEPDFDEGKGILNATIFFKDIPIEDLIEEEATQEEIDSMEKLNIYS